MTVRFLIRGVVQGVGFRYFAARRATALGIHGWARNLPDGRVEVLAAGSEDAIAGLEAALGSGPPRSQVRQVEKTEVSDEVVISKSFEIK
jgi:acylphosphatase